MLLTILFHRSRKPRPRRHEAEAPYQRVPVCFVGVNMLPPYFGEIRLCLWNQIMRVSKPLVTHRIHGCEIICMAETKDVTVLMSQ